jgi:hypothetical protein
VQLDCDSGGDGQHRGDRRDQEKAQTPARTAPGESPPPVL